LRSFLDRAGRGEAALPRAALVATASRSHRASELANLIDRLPVQEQIRR